MTDIKILEPGLNTLFMKHYKEFAKKLPYEKIATTVKSAGAGENYSWLTDTPSMREFTDERNIKSLGSLVYTLNNKTWEATLGIERNAVEDDLCGQIQLRIKDLAYSAAGHRNRLVFEALEAGITEKCFDGETFFSSSHTYPEKSAYRTAQSNLNTLELTEANLKASVTAMGQILNSEGEPMNIVPDTLVVPRELEWTAKELVYSPSFGDSHTANALRGMLEVIVSPYIKDSGSWFLLDCSGGLKPIILQERSNIELTALGGDSPEGFMRDMYYYGVRARYNAGYSYWQLAYANIPD